MKHFFYRSPIILLSIKNISCCCQKLLDLLNFAKTLSAKVIVLEFKFVITVIFVWAARMTKTENYSLRNFCCFSLERWSGKYSGKYNKIHFCIFVVTAVTLDLFAGHSDYWEVWKFLNMYDLKFSNVKITWCSSCLSIIANTFSLHLITFNFICFLLN